MEITGHYGLLILVLWPFVSAFISYAIGRKSKPGRDVFLILATAVEFAAVILMASTTNNEHPHVFEWTGFMGSRILLQMDGLRCIYAVITAFMWLITTVFSKEYFAHYRNRNRYYFFMLLTLGGTMGVFLSGDLITTFLFFEMMSFTSYVMVLHDEKPAAIVASKTYMAVAVIGGLAMIFGIFIVNAQLHTTEIGALYDAMHHFEGDKRMLYLAAAFMLVGFGGKAGMYPLHIWLPNAHPVAPAPASALLSGVLTKTGIYGIIIMSVLMFAHDASWGMVMLIIGVLGMFTGAFLALFSIDLKRTLACSSVSQIGFIIVGIGMQGILGEENALAVRGTMLHMVNHSLIKLVLFIMAGVVYVNLHQLDLNKVRGFGRGKPLFTFIFLMGVMGIIGIPFWNGYISKTMLHESIVEQIWLYPEYSSMSTFFQIVESIFTLTGGLTTAYMIKIFTCVCIEKNQFNQEKLTGLNKKYITRAGAAVLLLSALILPVLGFSPYTFMIPISKFAQEFMRGEDPAHAVEFFAWANVRGAVASLSIGAIIYTFVVRGCLMAKDEENRSIYINAWPKAIDIEQRVYRPLLLTVLPFIGAFAARFAGSALAAVSSVGYRGFTAFRNFAQNEPLTFDIDKARSSYQKTSSGIYASIGKLFERGEDGLYEKTRSGISNFFGRLRGSREDNILLKISSGISGFFGRLWGSGEDNVYLKIRSGISGFFLRIWGRQSDVGFELFKTVLNSLGYSLLLLLTGMIIVLVVIIRPFVF